MEPEEQLRRIRMVLRWAYARIADDENKEPSPWFGELIERFARMWNNDTAFGPLPERRQLQAIAFELGLSFRTSGDWSESFRTIFHNPTQADIAYMESMASKKLAAITREDKTQTKLFEGE
jgi:hypothetical protein